MKEMMLPNIVWLLSMNMLKHNQEDIQVKEKPYIQWEISMMGILLMESGKEEGNTFIVTAINTMENGKTT